MKDRKIYCKPEYSYVECKRCKKKLFDNCDISGDNFDDNYGCSECQERLWQFCDECCDSYHEISDFLFLIKCDYANDKDFNVEEFIKKFELVFPTSNED